MEIRSNLSGKAQQDYRLVNRARSGNEQAFAELLERYKDSIYYMLLKKVSSEMDAEDLTIEAFGKAFNSLGQYTPHYAFSTWLYKIANNNCIDYLRKKKNRIYPVDNKRDGEESNSLNEVPSSILDPEERVIKEQKAEMLKAIVKNLKPRYSHLIQLRYYEELSYEEIAQKLEIPIGTVKAQLFRARELLHAMLKLSYKNM